jgi:N-acetylmuramoyl-L-alanine amidase
MKNLYLNRMLFVLINLWMVCSCSSKRCIVKDKDPEQSIRSISPAAMQVVPSYAPLRCEQKTIVIDPGHGGKDVGTEAALVVKEKNCNLYTAQFVASYLKLMGYQIAMTRSDDQFVPLKKRVAFANGKNADLFVSIHYNSAPSTHAEGIEIFYYPSNADEKRTKNSKLLAEKMLSRVIQNSGAKSRGVKQGNLAVIRETKMAAVLIEGGFLTNQHERERLQDNEYLKKIAYGIALGVHDFLSAHALKVADGAL